MPPKSIHELEALIDAGKKQMYREMANACVIATDPSKDKSDRDAALRNIQAAAIDHFTEVETLVIRDGSAGMPNHTEWYDYASTTALNATNAIVVTFSNIDRIASENQLHRPARPQAATFSRLTQSVNIAFPKQAATLRKKFADLNLSTLGFDTMAKAVRQPLPPIVYIASVVVALLVGIAMISVWTYFPPAHQNGSPFLYVTLLVLGLGCAAFLFGAIGGSYAVVRGERADATFEFGGPIVGAILVVVGGFYLTDGEDPLPVPPTTTVRVFHGQPGTRVNAGQARVTVGTHTLEADLDERGETEFKDIPGAGSGMRAQVDVLDASVGGLQLAPYSAVYDLGPLIEVHLPLEAPPPPPQPKCRGGQMCTVTFTTSVPTFTVALPDCGNVVLVRNDAVQSIAALESKKQADGTIPSDADPLLETASAADADNLPYVFETNTTDLNGSLQHLWETDRVDLDGHTFNVYVSAGCTVDW